MTWSSNTNHTCLAIMFVWQTQHKRVMTQSWSSEVSWRQKRVSPECDLQFWLRRKDYFSTVMPEGRRVHTGETQNRAERWPVHRREGMDSEAEAEREGNCGGWVQIWRHGGGGRGGGAVPLVAHRITTVIWTVCQQPLGASAVQLGGGLRLRLSGGWRPAGLQHSEPMEKHQGRGRRAFAWTITPRLSGSTKGTYFWALPVVYV